MKEIILRAKAINRDLNTQYRTSYKNGDWVYGLLERHKLDFGGGRVSYAEMRDSSGISGIDIDEDTLGQYIGILDKNDTLIFEGDIIKVSDDHESDLHVVEYQTDLCAYKFIPIRSAYTWLDLRNYKKENLEVVGNIYDNKELL